MVEGLIEKYRLGDLITKPKQDEEMVKSLERMESSLDFEIERIAKEQVNFKKLHLKFPVIDPSFLRRKSQKPHIVNTSEDGNIFSLFLPRFAIYSLDSNKCGFSIDVECEKTGGRRAIPEKKELKISYNNFYGHRHPILDKEFRKAIEFNEMLANELPREKNRIDFSSVFTGYFPQHVRQNIKLLQGEFGTDIYIISEAESWKSRVIPVADPLVIGVKYDICFLLDKFDCSPIEEHAIAEYSNSNGNER